MIHALRKGATNIGLLLATLALLILLSEWLLRALNIQRVPPLNPPIYRKSENEILSYELLPSVREKAYGETVTMNDIGLRSPPLDTSDLPLLAVLGDSTVFGFGVADDETIPSYLQELLPRHRVLNAGVCGYNIEQETEQYRTLIAPLAPAVVVLIFNHNDVDDAMRLDGEGYFVPRSFTGTLSYAERLDALLHRPGTLPIPFKTFLQTKSALFNLLVRASKNIRARPTGSLSEEPTTAGRLERYHASLARLTAMLGDRPRLFVIWPEAPLHLQSRAILTRMAEEQGWRVLDLYEIYGNSYPSLGWDGHPNAATNRHTAGIITDALKSWNMIVE